MDNDSCSEILKRSIKLGDVVETRKYLDHNKLTEREKNTVLHLLLEGSSSNGQTPRVESFNPRVQITYMLCACGANVDQLNQDDHTPLQVAAHHGMNHPCEALLQCGADMYVSFKEDGKTLFDDVTAGIYGDGLKRVFGKYKPGLWNAVTTESIEDVRRLVNVWCRTDVSHGGVTVVQKAIQQGSESIVKLIQPIMPSMKLAHAVLAQDLGSVKSLCQEKVINMGFRNLGDHGASILYYAVRSDNLAIVKELLANRVKADVTMEDSHGVDISMILAAIFNHPSLSREVVRVVCEHIAYLHTLYYKGHNCMMAAIDNDVSLPICQELLSCGGPSLLCDRSQANLTPRDYSEKQGKSQYIHVIDNLVYDWVTQPTKHPGKRSQLPMLGYNHIRHATSMEGVSVEDFAKSNPDVQKYLEEIDKVQERIARLALFLQRGDTIKFKQQFCDVSLLARRRGDGLPLLHAAVLNRQYEIVEYMIFHKDEHLHVDEVRDLTGRTALHYACAMEGVKHIEYLLSEQGACEYIVDKRGFMPVDFRERRGTNAMLTLLQRQIERDYGTPEPNPWQVQKRRSAPSPFSAMPLLMHPLINPHVHPHPSHPLNLHGYGAMGALGPMGATYVDSVSEDQVSYTKGSHQNLRKAKSKAGSSCRVM